METWRSPSVIGAQVCASARIWVVPRKECLSSRFGMKGLFFCSLPFRRNEHERTVREIKANALTALEAAATPAALEELRVKLLGKKGELTGVLKTMGKLSAEERPVMGQAANNVRAAIEEKIETVRAELKEKAMEARLEAEAIDVTIPGTPVSWVTGIR